MVQVKNVIYDHTARKGRLGIQNHTALLQRVCSGQNALNILAKRKLLSSKSSLYLAILFTEITFPVTSLP